MDCGHQITLKSGISVPCGKCPACLANQRAEWIFRLKEEAKASLFCVFVTLTYDEEHVPAGYNVNKKDVQLFHKRLRKHFPSGDMRFYLVSEYGDNTFRPHYHGLYFFKHRYDIKQVYDIFEKSWNLGFIKFGEVEEGSIVYCTKYCLKRKQLPSGRISNFRLCSKMDIGGIGVQYLNKMREYHEMEENFTCVVADGCKSRMPRYYRDKIKPRGGFKYNPLHFRDEDREYEDRIQRARKRYAEFLAMRGFSDSEETREAYAKNQRLSLENRDSLILKHCKKQKF